MEARRALRPGLLAAGIGAALGGATGLPSPAAAGAGRGGDPAGAGFLQGGEIRVAAPRRSRPAGRRRTATPKEAPDVEANEKMMDLIVFYTRNLAVPARPDVDDARVLAGKRLF